MRLRFALLALTIYGAAATGRKNRKKKIGITFNSGSNTAGNANAGFMRGFQQQMVEIDGEERPSLEAVSYISGVSAGSFVSTIYHFQNSTTADVLFDVAGPTDPSEITEEVLSTIPQGSIFPIFTVTNPAMVFFGQALQIAIPAAVHPLPIYFQFQFLNPFNIEADLPLTSAQIRDDVKSTPIFTTSMIGPAELYPSHVDSVINRAVFAAHNQSLDMLEMVDEDETEFSDIIEEIIAVAGESFAINVRRTDLDVLRLLAEAEGFQINLPAYGTNTEFTIPLSGDVATFDFDGDTIGPFDFQGPYTATYDELSAGSPFTLQKLVGMSGDLLGLFPGLRSFIPVPAIQTIPLSLPIPTVDGNSRNVAFTDGGISDTTGLAALLKMKPDKVIVCHTGSTSQVRLQLGPEVVSTISFQVFNTFGNIFGLTNEENPDNLFSGQTLSHLFNLYSNNENQFVKLVKTFESLRDAGEPLVTTLEGLEVIDNEFWGIKGGWTVDVTIIHMFGVPQKFVDDLPDDIAPPPPGKNKTEFGFFTNEEFASVPNNQEYGTFVPYEFQGTFLPAFNPELPSRPARMTQILTSWVINRAWDGLVGADGEVKFGGFGKLLEEKLDVLQEGGTSGSWALHLEGVCAFICLFLPMGFWVWF
mmetsp:Transcript_8944/g.11987  ORF Transcript_8944/g.11987 Transcript_8944/m.11987 type:complete len:643 (+) Transcript_8944:108-2036(+)